MPSRPAAKILLLGLFLSLPLAVRSQVHDVESVRSLLDRSSLADALVYAETDEETTIEELIRICQIPAPPFAERERAEYFRNRLIELGLFDVHIDEEGNVLGTRRGSGGGPLIVLSAHLDTVFPEDTQIYVSRRGSRLYAPGIGDDSAGLATLLATIRALDSIGARTKGDIVIVGTVGEEGLGDLRGVKYLFTRGKYRGKIDTFISVDGAGPDRITYKALGSLRYRVTFSGPGGHSWQDFGMSSPAHALGRAIHALLKADFSRRPLVSYNVGRVGGGTSVNSVPHEAWMEVDLRSTDPQALLDASEKFKIAMDHAGRDERRFGARARKPLRTSVKMIGDRPSGAQSRDSEVVRIADAVIQALGGQPFHTGPTSSDSNIPISLGVPALTLGTGGEGGGAHSLGEWIDVTDFSRGVKQLVTIAVLLAGFDEGGARGVD